MIMYPLVDEIKSRLGFEAPELDTSKMMSEDDVERSVRGRKLNSKKTALFNKLESILSAPEQIVDEMKNTWKRTKDIDPVYYAALLLASGTYVKVWYNCFTKEIIPTLSKTEKDLFTMKFILTLYKHLTVHQRTTLIKTMLKDLDPKTGILIHYYFPQYLKKEHHDIINKFLSRYDSDAEIINGVVDIFEKRTKKFFSDVRLMVNKE